MPYTPSSGPDVEVFARVVAEHRPKLYVTNSALHNPTGAIFAGNRASGAEDCRAVRPDAIIEDDIFTDFEHVTAPRLAAFDGLDRVVHIGSFSKTLSASARCGFHRRQAALDRRAGTDLKIATSFGGGRGMRR